MIRLFAHNETDFTHNRYILQNVISCDVQEEAAGIFSLELISPYNDNIQEDAIIKAPTPRGEQLFRIKRVTKILNGSQRACKVYAEHIFYDLGKNFLISVNPTDSSCQDALNLILSGAVTPHSFTGASDIEDIHSTSYTRQNPVKAIIGGENSILNVWGGFLMRDNFNIKIMNEGKNLGYEIRLGKNLIGVVQNIDFANVVTRIYPTTVITSDEITTLPELFVDSPLIGSYAQPSILEFTIALSEEEKKLSLENIYAIMRAKAQAKFAEGVDKPSMNYKVDFIHMGNVARLPHPGTGLAQFTHDTLSDDTHSALSLSVHGVAFGDPADVLKKMNELDLYDTVSIYVNKLGIYLQARVIKYTYDSLRMSFKGIELGDYKPMDRYKSYRLIQDMEKNFKLKANQSAIDNGTQKLTDNGLTINMPGGGVILSTVKGFPVNDNLGSDTQNIESGFPLRMDFEIDSEVTEITKVLLKYTNYPFRTDAKTIASGGGTKTSSTKASQSVTSASGNLNESVTGAEIGISVSGGGPVMGDLVTSGGQAVQEHVHYHDTEHSHGVTIPSHEHTVDTEHQHGIDYGIVETPITNQENEIWLDGSYILTTTAAQGIVDLKQYIASLGWHSLEVRSSTQKRVNASVVLKSYMRR